MKYALSVILISMSCAVHAQDILVIGEVHDNPMHHTVQAEQVQALAPAALVFEMLTPDQADGITLDVADAARLEDMLGWAGTGWPDFAMYYPIFAAAPASLVYGAGLPRAEAMEALNGGMAATFGEDAPLYGLDQPLPDAQQAAREALQFAAHCDAIPEAVLPGMVNIQRLRDAKIARAAHRAFLETGGPVAIITGNGHARRDWGVPAYLSVAAPALNVKVIGQTEDDAPLDGGFDVVISAPAVKRPDPCDAFK